MSPLIWIPITIILMYANMWISHKSSQNPQEIKWFYYNWLFLACTPIWSLIAWYSKNLVFDAMLFDVVLCISCTIFAIWFTKNEIQFNNIQWVGIAIVLIGFVVFKLGDLK